MYFSKPLRLLYYNYTHMCYIGLCIHISRFEHWSKPLLDISTSLHLSCTCSPFTHVHTSAFLFLLHPSCSFPALSLPPSLPHSLPPSSLPPPLNPSFLLNPSLTPSLLPSSPSLPPSLPPQVCEENESLKSQMKSAAGAGVEGEGGGESDQVTRLRAENTALQKSLQGAHTLICSVALYCCTSKY